MIKRVHDPGLEIEEEDGPDGATLRINGDLGLESLQALSQALSKTRLISLDLTGLRSIDGAAASTIAARLALKDSPAEPTVIGATEQVSSMLALYKQALSSAPVKSSPLLPPPRHSNIAEQVGKSTLELIDGLRDIVEYVGSLTLAIAGVVRRPRSLPWTSVWRLIERQGADGIPIVILITFLVGFVTAFQAALQLQKFAAESLVAELVGLSLTRELAPLMTAIVIAGRSGAAIAAELGTMRVSEEVDALQTMGLDPHRFLVLPRLLSLLVVTPVLTLMADLVGIAGGMLVAVTQLELSWLSYLHSTQAAVAMSDVLGGLGKAVIFGGLVGVIASQRGLATSGGAEGVGRSTTSAVVISLFALVSADAVFGVLFSLWGL